MRKGKNQLHVLHLLENVS